MNQLQDAIENIIPRGASSSGGGGDQPRQNVQFNSSSNAFDIGDPYIESMVVQRNNLMLLLKLVIKGLFRHRSKLVMTAECRTYFEHLFVLLEKCLQHGLKQRKQMFSVKTDIWNVIELTGKTLSSLPAAPNEASEMLESVRHLPKLRSPTARARAWLRLAMMKKKLPECLQSLLDYRESLLVELYEPWALLMTEEANLLAGLLVGLNSFDYTVYLKGDDSVLTAFEHEPVIDLQYYLQDPYGAADVQVFSEKKQQQQQMTNGEQLNNSENGNGSKDEVDREEMATAAAAAAAPNVEVLLEQNSYVEEINKHLKATIKTLEEKIETLLERRSGSVSSSSNDGHNSNQPPHSSSSARSLMEFGTALVAKEKQIMEEERRRREAEKRLEMEAKLREESETARNCLERDIQEKQETIVTLRAQLDEVKAINITMFSRLQEREREAKERARRTTELETLLGQQKKEIGQLEKRCAQLSESLDSGGNHNDHSCDSSGNGKDELLASYQKLIDEQQEQMTVLQLEVEELGTKATFSAHLKEAYSLLKKKFDENELALEEIGKQLQDSKLEIESLKEYNGHLKEAAWAKDSEAARCRQCEREFTLARRKHHCRSCGEIFCAGCSNNEMPLPSSKKPVRVCDACHAFLLERYSAHSSTST